MTNLPPQDSASWQSIVARFHSGIDVQSNGCWVCRSASLDATGYRRLTSNRKPEGRFRISTHRLSYTLHIGAIPQGSVICHSCDNRECCNPAHLFAGSHADNARDAVLKRRTCHGERHPEARITRDDAAQVRARCAAGERQSEVGRQYGISQAAVSTIVRGRTWKELEGAVAPTWPKRTSKPCSVVDCANKARKGGLCLTHHGRLSRFGSTEPPPKATASVTSLIVDKMLRGIVHTKNGCWECDAAGYSHGSGYGRIMVDRSNGSLRDYVHRISYQHFKGHIPSGFVVRHSCDNRRCCNPDHLVLGTQSDNMTDMVLRGRSRKGERHHNARLTSRDVRKIRQMRGKVSQSKIAAMFGITQPTVSDIIRGKKWSHI